MAIFLDCNADRKYPLVYRGSRNVKIRFEKIKINKLEQTKKRWYSRAGFLLHLPIPHETIKPMVEWIAALSALGALLLTAVGLLFNSLRNLRQESEERNKEEAKKASESRSDIYKRIDADKERLIRVETELNSHRQLCEGRTDDFHEMQGDIKDMRNMMNDIRVVVMTLNTLAEKDAQ